MTYCRWPFLDVSEQNVYWWHFSTCWWHSNRSLTSLHARMWCWWLIFYMDEKLSILLTCHQHHKLITKSYLTKSGLILSPTSVTNMEVTIFRMGNDLWTFELTFRNKITHFTTFCRYHQYICVALFITKGSLYE